VRYINVWYSFCIGNRLLRHAPTSACY